MSFDLATYPIWLNLGVFLTGACLVWFAGNRLAQTADEISERTGITKALAGALLLGGATSLPEIATTVTASGLGNASLAVNNLFGGVAMQLALLALIDFLMVKGALTFAAPEPVLLLSGVLLTLQIAVGVTAIASGDISLFGYLGFWPWVIMAVYLLSLVAMNRFARNEAWVPAELPETPGETEKKRQEEVGFKSPSSLIRLWAGFAIVCSLVLLGGFLVSSTADALAEQTGLAGGFVGATFVAMTTSLPEISTTAGAIRLGGYTMAISNIFGTNSLEVALLLPSDLAYLGGPIVNAVDQSVVFMGGVGIILTSLYLWGLLERRDRTVARMGIDSCWVASIYILSLFILYTISGTT
ncbi:putative calcium/sodium:proton antiporter [Planctomycetes bacterium Pan216]|uniref:Putative calcium/sodium:proton antiporter n=1 Tax=Kolteria novifilia TaxID=2527975 RepID=A0A518AXI5_9BACT|nr:putative calcium/sodium:proton antiporter [Planctomycetes bacterium Pan216]